MLIVRKYLVMFDDDIPKVKPETIFPRNLENLSVSDLEEYIKDLQYEITRASDDMDKKKTSQNAAAAFFK